MFFFWLASSILVLTLMIAGGQIAKMVKSKIGINRLRRIVGVAMVLIGFTSSYRAYHSLMRDLQYIDLE